MPASMPAPMPAEDPDPFASVDLGAEPPDVRASLFEAPPPRVVPPPAPAPLSEDIVELAGPERGSTHTARLQLSRTATVPPAPALQAAPAPAPSAPVRAPGAAAWMVNGALGLVLLCLLGAVVVVGLNEGGLPLGAGGNGPASEARAAEGRKLVTRDVSNGLYDTRSGRPVFFVRGEVENRGTAPTRIQVRVEIRDGAQRLRTGLGLAGQSATPEELHGLSTLQDLEALRARLDTGARALAPGERAPFLVAFVEYPPHLGRYRLHVQAEPAGQGEAAAR